MSSEASSQISHVSDTALMVAACRAYEAEQPDAFVRDPFAARLAGERGVAILYALPNAFIMRFAMAVRTRYIDELLLQAIEQDRIATVLSLGCGLDTRPWRLELSRDLRWIEVDFADVLDYKERLMAGERTLCKRERLSVDLTDEAGRRAMFKGVGGAPALMITEGLLLYLPAATAEALVAESWKNSGVAHWIVDFTTTTFTNGISGGQDTLKPIRHVQAPDALKGERIMELAQKYGWKSVAQRSYFRPEDLRFAAARIKKMTGSEAPPPPPIPMDDPSGVHLFGR